MGGASTASERARTDIAEGRLWKARDRLSAAFRRNPTDQEVLDLLGEVHFRMGDGPAAWRYWALTARTGADVEAAELAFDERYARGGLADRLSRIPAREPLEQYPDAARERLLELRRRARASGVVWPRPPSNDDRPEAADDDDEDDDFWGCLLAAGIGLALVGPWLVGFAVAVYLLGSWVVDLF